MTLVVVEVAAVLVAGALGSGGGDGNINLLDGDLKNLTVLGDVLGGDNLALRAVSGIVDGRRGSDGSGGDLLVAGGGRLRLVRVRGGRAGNLLLAGERAGGVVGVLALFTEEGGGGLAKDAILAAGGRLGGLARFGAGLGGVGVTADTGVGSGVLGTVLHGDTERDALLNVQDVLVLKDLRHVESALGGVGVRLDVENRAVLNAAGVVLASVESILEEVLGLPAHDEVTVVAGADGVTVGESELTVLTSEGLGGPDGLVEEEGVVDVVTLRALALLDQVRVGNVGLVVVRVGLAGTAARETHLETHAVLAVGVHVGLLGQLVTVERRLGGLVVVEAVEANSALGQPVLVVVGLAGPGTERLVGERAIEGTGVLVTSNHLEALGEGLDVVHVVQVVGEKTTDLGNDDGGAVAVDEVERGSPVGRLVLGDGARSAGTLGGQLLVGGLHGEVLE